MMFQSQINYRMANSVDPKETALYDEPSKFAKVSVGL